MLRRLFFLKKPIFLAMKLEIITPDKKVFRGEVSSVRVPGATGSFEVLRNHAPIISKLDGGAVRVAASAGKHEVFDEEAGALQEKDIPGGELHFQIGTGVIEVLNNEIVILSEDVKAKA